VTVPARRSLVRSKVEKGVSERRALAVARMSASASRYEARYAAQLAGKREHQHRTLNLASTQAGGVGPALTCAGRSIA